MGDAVDGVTASIADGWAKLDEHWDGGAAQNCGSYIGVLAEALGMEGPLNRTVGDLYKLIATEAENVMLEIAGSIKIPTEDIAIEFGSYGVCAIEAPSEDALKMAKDILDKARVSVRVRTEPCQRHHECDRQGQGVPRDLETVSQISSLDNDSIRELSKMSGHISDEQLEQLEKTVGDFTDLVELADTDNWANAPTDAFDVGDNPERDGA